MMGNTTPKRPVINGPIKILCILFLSNARTVISLTFELRRHQRRGARHRLWVMHRVPSAGLWRYAVRTRFERGLGAALNWHN